MVVQEPVRSEQLEEREAERRRVASERDPVLSGAEAIKGEPGLGALVSIDVTVSALSQASNHSYILGWLFGGGANPAEGAPKARRIVSIITCVGRDTFARKGSNGESRSATRRSGSLRVGSPVASVAARVTGSAPR